MASAVTSELKSMSWPEKFTLNGYYLKPVMIGTLFAGLYLHISVLFFGHALVLKHVVTPTFDMLLTIPMAYGAIVSWIVWRRVMHPNRWHRFIYGVLAVYFTISIPFHVRTYITGNTDMFTQFPVWYSAILLPFLTALIVFTWGLQFKAR